MILKGGPDISAEEHGPIIAFVWRPHEISQTVALMARSLGGRAIFDFSMMEMEALHAFLQKADPAGDVTDIKISAAVLMNPSLERLREDTGVRNLWVECQSHIPHNNSVAILERLQALCGSYRCYPIIGNVSHLAAMATEGSGIGRIVLKGCEASGFVSGETTLTLHSAIKGMITPAKSPDILIWGGVWTPEAAAALLSTGASGIVFESVHWLTDLVAIDDLRRDLIARLRMDSTALVGLDVQVPCRLFNKGNSVAFKEIKAIEDSLCAAQITRQSGQSFFGQVQARFLPPLESHFTQDEVIPLGVEASFAASFAVRFGTGTAVAIDAFIQEIQDLCRSAEAKKGCFLQSPVARDMGIQYPFIQGAMSCITDVPEFALKVAEAGGLPTIALGLMDADARDRISRMAAMLQAAPFRCTGRIAFVRGVMAASMRAGSISGRSGRTSTRRTLAPASSTAWAVAM